MPQRQRRESSSNFHFHVECLISLKTLALNKFLTLNILFLMCPQLFWALEVENHEMYQKKLEGWDLVAILVKASFLQTEVFNFQDMIDSSSMINLECIFDLDQDQNLIFVQHLSQENFAKFNQVLKHHISKNSSLFRKFYKWKISILMNRFENMLKIMFEK